MSKTTLGGHVVTPEEVMAYLDGEVSGERGEFLAGHLKTCVECQQIEGEMRANTQTMSLWTIANAPQGFDARVLSAFEKSGGRAEGNRMRWPQFFAFRRGIAALAWVSVAVALVAVFASRQTQLFQAHPATPSIASEYLYRERVAGGGGSGAAKDRASLSESVEKEPPSSVWMAGVQAPLIARTAELSIVVKDIDPARGSLTAILARHHGYAAELTVNTEQDAARSLQASLRIPAAELDAAVAELKALGRVETETQKGEEVTAEHADLLARLKNARETEQRLQAILQERTGKIGDVLEVEKEMARVRGEIEEMEGEQKTLEHRIEFSSIELKLAEEFKEQLGGASSSISGRLRNAVIAGYCGALESLVSLVVFLLGYGLTLVLWLAILYFPLRLLWQRWRRAAVSV